MTKAEILKEIARTAAANGGAPLGRLRFFRETGIRESDWIGKYWVRWSEALREAGFAPNELQGAYSDAELLDKYIAFVRELGRVPTAPEFRLKGHVDPGFPNQKTFRRFGGKAELIRRVIEYCRERQRDDDVVRVCESYSARHDASTVREPIPHNGFVYLAKFGRFYKIGRTNAVGRREYELSIQLPERVRVIHQIATDDPEGIECYWHRRFDAKRKNGEWFELNASDVAAFRRRKSM